MLSMNTLTNEDRMRVVAALVEGNSIRSTSRMTGVARNTITKLLVDLGQACLKFHDENVRNVRVRHLQCDEIWAHIGVKAKNVCIDKKELGWGDIWTWVGIDADTKLCASYLVGGRGLSWATDFMQDCASRIRGRVQITMDAHRVYPQAIEDAFGADCDYAQLQKIYGAILENENRDSPATCIGCDIETVSGDPDSEHVSTSFVERQNLTMRMSMRRFTRLTNGFSKKIENHTYAVSLHFMYCNFVRIHQTLRVTPAMAAGISNRLWSMEDLVDLVDTVLEKPKSRGPYKKRISN